MISKKLKIYALGFCIVSSNSYVYSVETDNTSQKNEAGVDQFQKVVDEYKAYVAEIKPELRDEIVEFRKEISKINKQKREKYQKLSQEAQNYLAKEQEFRKRLPVRQKKMINLQSPDTVKKDDDKSN